MELLLCVYNRRRGMAKVRFQMFIDEDQKRVLEKLQRDTHIPMAGIIRSALERWIEEYKAKKKVTVEDAMTEKMLSVMGVCEGGPGDLADEHDKYLYGSGSREK
jgi:hypothetical protein